MLTKLLFKNQDYKQLLIALFGGVLGLLFMMGSIHFITRINEYGEGSEILGFNVILIQKNSSTSSSADFTDDEIEEFKKHYSIEALQPVRNNNFDVWLELDFYVQKLKTEVFIQSISTEFMQSHQENWTWTEESDYVPIIMPRDFLIMLNTFLSATGELQVSDEMATSLPFKMKISNNGKSKWYKAKIIGFTNELSGLLVPLEFMNFATDNFSNGEEGKVTQLILKSKKGLFGELEKYIETKNFKPKESQMVTARLKSFITALIYLVLVISISAVIGSMLILIQYMQLLIFQNKYEIKTLLNIGYSIKTLVTRFIFYFSCLFVFMSLVSFILLLLLKQFVNDLFYQAGITIEIATSPYVYLVIFFSFLLFFGLSIFNASRTIQRQFKNEIG